MTRRPLDLNRQIVNKNGEPLYGGQITFYTAGTRDKVTVFTEEDEEGRNPWALNEYGIFSGRLNPGTYDYEIHDLDGILIDRGKTVVEVEALAAAEAPDETDGGTIDPRGRIISAKKSENSSQNRFVQVVTANGQPTRDIRVLATETPLVYEAGGVRVTLDQDVVVSTSIEGYAQPTQRYLTPQEDYRAGTSALLSRRWVNLGANASLEIQVDDDIAYQWGDGEGSVKIGKGVYFLTDGSASLKRVSFPFFEESEESNVPVANYGELGSVFGDDSGEVFIVKRERYSNARPFGFAAGRIWYSTAENQWKRVIEGGESVNVNLCKLAEVAVFRAGDTAVIKGTRCEDSGGDYVQKNGLSVTATKFNDNVSLGIKSLIAEVGVGEKEIRIEASEIASIDLPADPANAAAVTRVKKHIYLKENAEFEEADEGPIDRRVERGGFYHPREMWRHVASVEILKNVAEGQTQTIVKALSSPDYQDESGLPVGAIVLGANRGGLLPGDNKGFYGLDQIRAGLVVGENSDVTRELGRTARQFLDELDADGLRDRAAQSEGSEPNVPVYPGNPDFSWLSPSNQVVASSAFVFLFDYLRARDSHAEWEIRKLNNDIREVRRILKKISDSMMIKTSRE